MGFYLRHREDYYLEAGTNRPLRIVLDEVIQYDPFNHTGSDHEYLNWTEWHSSQHDYNDFAELSPSEAAALMDVASLKCKIMAAATSVHAVPHAQGYFLTPMPRAVEPANRLEASPWATDEALAEAVTAAANGSWVAGVSPRFVRVTKAALRRQLLRQPPRSSVGYFGGGGQPAALASAEVPARWDAREALSACVGPKVMVDQGQCGSCWAWAAAHVMSARLCAASNGTINTRMSPQYLLECDTADEGGCGGGALDNVWSFLTSGDGGITPEGCDPYDPWNDHNSICGHNGGPPTKCSNHSADLPPRFVRASEPWSPAHDPGTPEQVREIQQEIVARGPVEAGISLFSDFAAYKRGVYRLTVNESYGGGHAVTIIGWGSDTKNGDYWLVQNTYGSSWGEGGFFRIRRGFNEIGIEQEVVAGSVRI